MTRLLASVLASTPPIERMFDCNSRLAGQGLFQDFDIGDADKAETLRATARALLVVASREEDYDVTLLPASCAFGLRARNTTFGPQAEVTETGDAAAEPGGSEGGDADPSLAVGGDGAGDPGS